MDKRLVGFFGCALALGIAPGPDVLFVLTQSLAQGFVAGGLVTLGLCTGLCLHVTLAAFGIAALLQRYPKAFTVVTWFGAAYLLYLAWLTWRGASDAPGQTEVAHLAGARLYLRGIVMNILNPKVMLFFLAFVPRFVRPENGHVRRQFLVLGALFAIATLLVFSTVAALGGAISAWLNHVPGAYRWLQYASAIVMLLIAAWIAWKNLEPAPRKARRSVPTILATTLLLATSLSCSREAPPPDATLRIGAAIPVQGGILRAMAPADRPLDVTVLIDGAQSPHAFEPSARQLAALSRCSIYFATGLPFERELEPRLRALNPSLSIVRCGSDPAAHRHHHEDGEADDSNGDHGDGEDPHRWTSPAGILDFATKMEAALETADPAHANGWLQGFEAFSSAVRERETALCARLEPHRGSAFLAYHPAWGRVAAEFGLRQLAVERHGGAPTAKHLAELTREARAEGIRAIVVQSDSEAARAQTFADSLGVGLVRANPMQSDPLALIDEIGNALEASLGR